MLLVSLLYSLWLAVRTKLRLELFSEIVRRHRLIEVSNI